jgi:hypothetical protein
MKKILLFSFLVMFMVVKVSAQLTLTVTVTNASKCTPPCDGTAAANAVPGATYIWNTTPVQTTSTATGLCPGTYSVTATLAPFGSVGGTGTVICTATGVNNVAVDENTILFPNPAHNVLNIEFGSAFEGKVNLVIRGVVGNVVLADFFDLNTSNNRSVNISSLPKGVYTVEFMTESTSIVKQFIKQ